MNKPKADLWVEASQPEVAVERAQANRLAPGANPTL
jgi:hypothetical protein